MPRCDIGVSVHLLLDRMFLLLRPQRYDNSAAPPKGWGFFVPMPEPRLGHRRVNRQAQNYSFNVFLMKVRNA